MHLFEVVYALVFIQNKVPVVNEELHCHSSCIMWCHLRLS